MTAETLAAPAVMSGAGSRRSACVAILLHDLRGGGAERVMLRLAREFDALGVDVDLVLVRKAGDYLDRIPPNVRVVDLGGKSVLSSVPSIAAYLRRDKPEAMLCALTHVNIAGVLARFLAPFSPTRLVLSERNQVSRKAASAKGLRERLHYALIRFAYPRADLVTTVSNGVADDLRAFAGLPERSVRTIYNPIAEPHMKELAAQDCPHPWIADKTVPVVLAVGRLNPQKGFDVLLKAFADVRKTRDCRLVILGEGAEREALQGLADDLGISDSVDLHSFVDNPYCYMSRADLFVLSSRFEGLPGALIEAMYCGAPVISTDCPSGPAEILDRPEYGTLVPVDDVDAMARAIESALADPPPAAVARAEEFEVGKATRAYLDALGVRP